MACGLWGVSGVVLQKGRGSYLAAQMRHLLLHPLVEGVEGELELLPPGETGAWRGGAWAWRGVVCGCGGLFQV